MRDVDPTTAVTAEDLAECLNELYIQAGRPTLRTLERQTGRSAGRLLAGSDLKSMRLGRSSLNAVLRGRRFPKKAFLLTFVEVCGIDLGTDPRWGDAWDRLAYPGHYPDHDGSRLRDEIAALRERAEQAEKENRQLRQQLAAMQAKASASDQRSLTPQFVEPLRAQDPQRIGGFQLLGLLGSGGMGQVYLARSRAGRYVAVKTIRADLAEDGDFRSRFAREVASSRRVSGLFTAPVIAADPDADIPWLATAYIAAPPLSALIANCGPLPSATVRWLAAGCAEALDSFHSSGLIHRDLKPSNVLVAPDGPKVIDFGLARAAERSDLASTRAAAVGTPTYMAPEQVRDAGQVSAASDVFSLGATLLFAATGHAPYEGESVMDVLVRIATEPPDLSELPPDLTEIVATCLRRDPKDRPTAAELLNQLERMANVNPEEYAISDLVMSFITSFGHQPGSVAQDHMMSDTSDFSMPSQPGI